MSPLTFWKVCKHPSLPSGESGKGGTLRSSGVLFVILCDPYSVGGLRLHCLKHHTQTLFVRGPALWLEREPEP